ncbi:unnamed protein product [Discosporangium mesarthrocarpum]
MGDPTWMPPPSQVFKDEREEQEFDESSLKPLRAMKAQSEAVLQSLGDYKFGSANRRTLEHKRLSDIQILELGESQLRSIGVGNWRQLDLVVWGLIQNWSNNHSGLSSSRCLAVAFLNASRSTVQFLETRRRDGLGFRLMGGPLWDKDIRQLQPGGVAVLFAWGHPPAQLVKKGFVVMVVDTTAFSGVFAVQREKISMTSKGGFQAGFLEKTVDSWWGKQVVVIK